MTETWPVSKSDHVCTCWGASVKLWIVSEVEPKWCHATCCTARSNLLYFVALQESTAISFSACRCSSAILALDSRNNLLKRCCTFSNRALSIFVSWCLLWRRRVSQTWSPVLVVRSNFRKKVFVALQQSLRTQGRLMSTSCNAAGTHQTALFALCSSVCMLNSLRMVVLVTLLNKIVNEIVPKMPTTLRAKCLIVGT